MWQGCCFLSLLSRKFDDRLSSNFHRFVVICIYWDTPTVKASLWQLPIVLSAFKAYNRKCWRKSLSLWDKTDSRKFMTIHELKKHLHSVFMCGADHVWVLEKRFLCRQLSMFCFGIVVLEWFCFCSKVIKCELPEVGVKSVNGFFLKAFCEWLSVCARWAATGSLCKL